MQDLSVRLFSYIKKQKISIKKKYFCVAGTISRISHVSVFVRRC